MDLNEFAGKATTLELDKAWEDLSEAILLPEDWYKVEIQQATVKPNRKWLDANDEAGKNLEAKEIDGAGNNLCLLMKTKETGNGAYDGRSFFKYLPIPNPTDKGKFDMNGRDLADTKRDNIYIWGAAFEGAITGSQITFKPGLVANVYIHQGKDRNGVLCNELRFEEPTKCQDISEAISGAEGLL